MKTPVASYSSPVVLIVSATEAECAPILQSLSDRKMIFSWLFAGYLQGQAVEILISGIGAVATTFRLTQVLMQRSYRHAFSIGIAGSFADDIPIGELVQITEDCFADLGIDDNGSFLNLREAGLIDADNNFFSGNFIDNPFPIVSPYLNVRGITVQTASGNQKRIDELVSTFHPQVETMESAAFFYVCSMMQVSFASFRAISNKVEPRNRRNWRITEAIEKVNNVFCDLFTSHHIS